MFITPVDIYFYHLIRWSHLWCEWERENRSESVRETISMWIKIGDFLFCYWCSSSPMCVYNCELNVCMFWHVKTVNITSAISNVYKNICLRCVGHGAALWMRQLVFAVQFSLFDVTHSKSNNRDLITIFLALYELCAKDVSAASKTNEFLWTQFDWMSTFSGKWTHACVTMRLPQHICRFFVLISMRHSKNWIEFNFHHTDYGLYNFLFIEYAISWNRTFIEFISDTQRMFDIGIAPNFTPWIQTMVGILRLTWVWLQRHLCVNRRIINKL